jgi:hypothetical protein
VVHADQPILTPVETTAPGHYARMTTAVVSLPSWDGLGLPQPADHDARQASDVLDEMPHGCRQDIGRGPVQPVSTAGTTEVGPLLEGGQIVGRQ